VLGYLRELVGALHARGLSAAPGAGAWRHRPPWRTHALPRAADAVSRMCVELADYGPRLDKLELVRCTFEPGVALAVSEGRDAAVLSRASAPNAVECCAMCRALPSRACRCFEYDRDTRVCTLVRSSCGATAPRESAVVGAPCKRGPPHVTFASSGRGSWDERILPWHVRMYEAHHQ